MKHKSFVLAVYLSILLFGGLSAVNAQSRPAGLPDSMKGYELYSWRVRGDWYFSLLVGTNRLKTRAEITSPRVRVRGVEALKKKLRELPRGEELFWSTKFVPRMSLPTREVVEEVRAYCDRRGVTLRVGR